MIQKYMDKHAELNGADHPMAACCVDCAWKLDCSPTKDPDVPHCEFARRRRNLRFLVRVPKNKQQGDVKIPLCLQYKPTKAWKEIIPGHPHTPKSLDRDWVVSVIAQLASNLEHNNYQGRNTLSILVGIHL